MPHEHVTGSRTYDLVVSPGFVPPGAKISIGSIDEPASECEAQYNPKELQIDKSVPWQKHNKANANGLQLEFTGAEGRTMSVDLLFDGYEEKARA